MYICIKPTKLHVYICIYVLFICKQAMAIFPNFAFTLRSSMHSTYICMYRHNYIYACMYYLHVKIFPNFVFTLPSSMHTYICEAPCGQVDPKPERASVDFGFKIIFFNFWRPPPFLKYRFFPFLYVRACARACMHAHVHAHVFL